VSKAQPPFPSRWSAASGRILSRLILLLAVAAVSWYWLYGVNARQRDEAESFEQATRHAVEMLHGRFRFYENLAHASRGLFESSDEVSDEEWHTFNLALGIGTAYPGVSSIAFARYRATTASGSGSAGRHPCDLRGFAAEIVHVEPGEEPGGMVGYDLAGEPTTLQALVDSCAERQSRVSGVIVDPLSGRRLIRQVMPIFHHALPPVSAAQRPAELHGWVSVNYDVQQWLQHYVDDASSGDWQLSIGEAGRDLPFFSSAAQAGSPAISTAGLQRREVVALGGRHWIIEFAATPKFEQRYDRLAVHLLPLSALLLILSLWLVFRRLQSGRERALAMALGMTEQLRESEERYRQMFEANKAVELLIDPQDGRIVDANQAAANYYGYTRKVLQSMRIDEINTLSPEEVAAEMKRARNEQRNHFLFRHRHATGEVRDVEVHSGPIQVGGKPLLYSIVHDVTARMESERALRKSEARYRTIIDTTAEGYWLVELPSLRIVEVNDALCRMLGYGREELIGRHPHDFADAANRTVFEEQAASSSRSIQRSYEAVLRHRAGHEIVVAVHATSMPGTEEEVDQAFAFITDITERKRNEEQLRIAATFFDTTSEAITVTDMNNRIIAVNTAFCQITGYSEEEVLGKDPGFLGSGRNSKAFYRDMWRTLEQMGRWQGEIWNRRKNGEVFPEWLSIVSIKDEEGETRQYMAVFSDITRRKQDEEKIWRQANYDALTGLPNRNLFKDRLDQAMHAAHREDCSLALMFIDLDRFKWVNDTLGHAAGDLLLQEAGRRIGHCVRETDTVARLGGDEFTVIIGDVQESADVDRIAEKVLRHLAEPFEVEGKEAFVSGSIGITLYPADADNMEQLLRNADAAMYSAKEAGRNVHRYFTHELNEEAKRRLRLEADLRRVLERGELAVEYQPIVDAEGEPVGAEALLRWHHPGLGEISPDEFIPLAEEIGAIIDIEQWVIRQACHDASSLPPRNGESLFVSVNVSSMQCRSDQCQHMLGNILQESGLNPHRLKLEITERVMMENTEFVIALLGEIRTMGVRLAVDDFGTGYSSLSYLKQFPVDVLKIDRSFVSGLPRDRDDVAVVEAIVAMAHSLGMQVVAEGVETAEQLAFLRSLGCDMLQGFYFSASLPLEQFEEYLRRVG